MIRSASVQCLSNHNPKFRVLGLGFASELSIPPPASIPGEISTAFGESLTHHRDGWVPVDPTVEYWCFSRAGGVSADAHKLGWIYLWLNRDLEG